MGKQVVTAQKPRRCVICADPQKGDWVARRLMEGHSLSRMEDMSREAPVGVIKRETISAHKTVCLGTTAAPAKIAKVAQQVTKGIEPAEDVATLVQREVIERLKAGEARVTVQHGLQAQQLLDRRAERAKDRELAVTLARLLHTAPPPPHRYRERLADPVVFDGEAVEVG